VAQGPDAVELSDLPEREAPAAPSAARGGGGAAEPGEEPRRELSKEENAEGLRRYLDKLDPEAFGRLQM
jgi:hypothetical protein